MPICNRNIDINFCGILLIFCLALAVLFGACRLNAAEPARKPISNGPIHGPFSNLPGESKGKMQSGWIAPYVNASELTIGGRQISTVLWFDGTGRVVRTVIDGTPQVGFVFSKDCSTIYAKNEDWQLTLPKRNQVESYCIASENSKTLIYQFSPKSHQLSLDVYTHGKLVNSLGPFESYEGREVHVSEDGSAALLIWENSTKKNAQVVVLGVDGKQTFRVNVDHRSDAPIAAPDGTGVLLHSNNGGDEGNRFLWYTEKGKQRYLDVGPNGEFEGWVPGKHQALMSSSIGELYRYRLVDWDTGKTAWDVLSPGNGHTLAVTLTSEYALFAVVELYQPGPWSGESWTMENRNNEWIQSFYAIGLKDGSVIGYWRAQYPKRYCSEIDNGSFVQRGKDLYYVTPKEFVLINPLDIQTKQNGWGNP